jgi:uncharacterized membrane protein YhaH (DUF805 family)
MDPICHAQVMAAFARQLSIWDWVIGVPLFLAGSLIFLFPIAKILRRLGISGWWSLLTFIPVVNIISLWKLAYADWPRDRKA